MKFPHITVNRCDYEGDTNALAIRCYQEVLRFAGKCEARKYQDAVIRITDFTELVVRSCDWINVVYQPKE